MKRNQEHICFITNCQSELGPRTNCFQIGSKILAKNEHLLTHTLLILTTALEDIPDNLRSCDCHCACDTDRDAAIVGLELCMRPGFTE